MKVNRDDIGSRCREARKKAGLKQIEIGVLVGAGKSSVSSYESGLNSPPYDYLVKLSELSGLSLDWIITGADHQKTAPLASSDYELPSGAAASDHPSLGELVDLLVKICNSGEKVLVRAIAANLQAFGEAIDNKALADDAMQRMEQMEERICVERAALEQRLQALEERLSDGEGSPPKKKMAL